MDLRRLPTLFAAPLARPSQRRSRENAARAALICSLRRAERDDVEVFLSRLLPEQRRREEQRRTWEQREAT